MKEQVPRAPKSTEARRPSPPIDIGVPLHPKSQRRRRRSPHKAYQNEPPHSGSLEPLDLSRASQLFKYKSMGSRQDSTDAPTIPDQNEWIRLLRIFSSDSGKNHYELVTFHSPEHPLYKAISYVWGDPESSRYVSIVQGRRQGWLKVPVNLHVALETLRDETEDVLVWADSVCINQEDNGEKNQQLPRIPAIYGNAAQVVVWLGVEMDDSIYAQELLHGIAHAEVQLDPDVDLSAVVSLFDRDSWSRLWVVQELLHATDIVEIRDKLEVNCQLSIRQIYIDVVEVLLRSGHMDVICESIHFPPQISNANLPSWVPDWSCDPMARSLASLPLSFSAGNREPPFFRFYKEHLAPRTRSKLLIAGVRIRTIDVHGMAVSTHSRAADYCMAFLQWRVLLLQRFGIEHGSGDDSEDHRRCRAASCEHQRHFCLTLSLGQPTRTGSDGAGVELVDKETEWVGKCYRIFAETIKARLPQLPIDEDLMAFAGMRDGMEPEAALQFLQESFAKFMTGRWFCITDAGSLGLGSGAMARGDVVVVPYGCSTPVLLRPEGHSSENGDGRRTQEYRFVGDAYIHGYMDGKAMEQGSREEFVLH
ncbi:hypothetical protein LA080_011282 [Diaporthe eres]|nr:hypothetical protein LA080_011282 [Diaporthe eres]